jgi:hypothetical protein
MVGRILFSLFVGVVVWLSLIIFVETAGVTNINPLSGGVFGAIIAFVFSWAFDKEAR